MIPAMRTLAFRVLSYLCLSVFIGRYATSCSEKPAETITLYTSVDEPTARPIVEAFTKQTGIRVDLRLDTEATKSVGLAERLRAEKDHPVAHVFWGNEVFHTVNLADEGLFAPLTGLPELADIRPEFKDDQNRWAGVGLRARVLAVNENAGQTSGSINDLLDPKFKGKVAMARPLAGTTGGHVAALYALWGDQKADDFFRKLRDNGALLLGGNGPVAEQVGSGNVMVGLTDNDDVFNAQRSRGELWLVLPDQDGIGTLAIPTTVAIVNRPDTSEAARKLAAFLLSATNEQRLIDANFCAYRVRPGGGPQLKVMNVSYEKVAKLMATAPKRAADILDGRTK